MKSFITAITMLASLVWITLTDKTEHHEMLRQFGETEE